MRSLNPPCVTNALFQLGDLPVEQVGGHLDEADDHIGGDGRIFVFDAFAERYRTRRRADDSAPRSRLA